MLILASKSPRRKEFLEKACLDFIIDTVDTEEINAIFRGEKH